MSTVTIEWIQPDGRGAGRMPEGVVRLNGVVPGDVVDFQETSRKGRNIEGTVTAITDPSPNRVTPTCPWDAQCGGCDLSALNTEARHNALSHMVAQALRLPESPQVVRSPRATGHRARLKLSIQGDQVGYRAHRSHDLVAIDTCEIARPELNSALAALRAWITPGALKGLHTVEIRTDGTKVAYCFESSRKIEREVRDGLGALGNVALNGKVIAGDPKLFMDVAGLRLRASPLAFFQVNLEVDELLVAYVVEAIQHNQGTRVLDLYAGIGNLSLPIANSGPSVIAVELEGQSIGDLKHNAQRLALPVTAIAGKVERFDPSREAFDIVVLDPPRAGAQRVISKLLRNRPRAIIYVSCNIRSAARDLKEAQKVGYTIQSVRCFDLFPQTRHLETVIVLSR